MFLRLVLGGGYLEDRSNGCHSRVVSGDSTMILSLGRIFFTSKVGTDIEALPKIRLLCGYFVSKYLELS